MGSPTPTAAATRGQARIGSLAQQLFQPVDAASLAVFRMMFGAILFWEVVRYFRSGWIERYFVEPPFHFRYLFFDWVEPWPGRGMEIHFALMGLLALLVAAGLFYRPAVILLGLSFAYVFLLEQARYLNHFYLVVLLLFLLSLVGANRAFSLDRRLFFREEPQRVPAWQIWIFRVQLLIVYFYAGLAKVNIDWLARGEPVRHWIADRADAPVVGPLLTQEWMVWVIAYGGLVFDLSVGFLLLWRRTRLLGLLLSLAFHVGNNFLFQIGIFPYFAAAATLLFFDPDWPRRVIRWASGDRGWQAPAREDAAAGGPPLTPGRRAVLAGLGLYLSVQTLVPLRHWLYPGDVNWTEEGHRFSWRMKLRDKAGEVKFTLRDAVTGMEWEMDPHDGLTDWQVDEMAARPDMILQYAHRLRENARAIGVQDPQVRASSVCELNFLPGAELIDPAANLAAVPRGLAPARWILPRQSATLEQATADR